MNAPTTPPTPTSSPAPHPIPVVCDRCRAEGLSGEDPFEAFGELLDFAPVPRRKTRPDGWDHECQRAFIAALSLTGSVRAAARAVGKSTFGADQLRRAEGSESFLAAWDDAMGIAGDERSRRLAEGLRAIAAEQSGWRPPPAPWSHAATRGRPPAPWANAATRGRPPALPPPALPALPPIDPDDPHAAELTELRDFAEAHGREALTELEVGARIVRNYGLKLEAERRCRLEGRIAEADFYLRQVTMLEVALDVVIGNGMEVLRDARLDGHDLLHIAETDFSRALDAARRRHWEAQGEPPRPEYPPRHLLVHHEGHATEPLPSIRGGTPKELARQEEAQHERFRQDAEAQIEWEAEARRDYERRRATPPLMDEGEHRSPAGGRSRSGGGEAGQPAPEGRQD